MRNFGIMSSRASLGGASTGTAATRDEIHPRDSNIYLFPSGSILAEPAGSALERREPVQALRDGLFVASAALFVTAFSIGVAFALFTLLFVKV